MVYCEVMDLDDFLELRSDLLARYGPPLKAVRMSRLTAASFPTVPTQGEVETLHSVPIQWDDTLDEGEYVPVYQ